MACLEPFVIVAGRNLQHSAQIVSLSYDGRNGSETNRKLVVCILKTLVHFYNRDGNESKKSLGNEELGHECLSSLLL